VGRGADAAGKFLARSWKLPPRRNQVTIDAKVRVPMPDGTILLADHYIPVTGRAAATVLVRCPYGRGAPLSLTMAQLLAERGYHVLLQSCRGTFGSGGEFEPMRNEIADGRDTVSWLREQSWFDGRLATYGPSYLGFTQWALAMDPPQELIAAVVFVGPHDFSRSAYRNGVFDLYNWLQWSDLIANQEHGRGLRSLIRTVTTERRLHPAVDRMPFIAAARDVLGTDAPWFESWPGHPDLTDPFWAPLQCGAAVERITAPTLLIGGWQDLFIEQTLEQYRVLAGRGVPSRLLVGPWTHLDAARSGLAAAESLDWLDRYTGTSDRAGSRVSPATEGKGPVRIHVGGARQWREVASWPPPGAEQHRWYLAANGTLSSHPGPPGADASFRYDPADPTPSVGGATMVMTAGSRDNQAIEQRPDVLVFSTEPLDAPAEVIGDVIAELSVSRDNPYADVFVRLCDVDPRGRSRNVCDGIVRLTDADALSGVVRISLLGAAHRFDTGHRIRLQIAGGAHPRFAPNPGNGQLDAPASDLVPTTYGIGTGGESALLLGGTAGPEAGSETGGLPLAAPELLPVRG
jgi:putative CocE/NonD family hydrolase